MDLINLMYACLRTYVRMYMHSYVHTYVGTCIVTYTYVLHCYAHIHRYLCMLISTDIDLFLTVTVPYHMYI